MTDVLIIIGTGEAPALQSRQFTLPVMAGSRMVLVSSAFPVMSARTSTTSLPTRLVLDNRELPVAPITSIDLMARRRLQDDMPGIMLRATIRTATSAALQYQVQRAGAGDRDAAAAAALASLAIGLGSAMLSSADDRTWRALPSEVTIARVRLPRGAHTVTVHTREGARSARVDLAGRYAVVDCRLLRHQLFVSAPKAR
jgi:uncharacterized protein